MYQEPTSDSVSGYEQQGCLSATGRAMIGLLLLLPGVLLCGATQLIPALGTVNMSLTDYDIITTAEYVGFENYTRLFEDPVFGEALSYTFVIIIARVFVVALVPPLIAVFVGLQGTLGRALNRLALALISALVAPVALVVLWRFYWSRMWGREPSPLFPPPSWLNLGDVWGARVSTILLDAFITLALALAVGVTAYLAAMRARRAGSSAWLKAFGGVWLIGVLVAAGSACQAFTIPFVLTRGGPANSTVSTQLYLYISSFQNIRFGYGAAQATLLMLLFMVLALLVWGVITLFRLRLSFTAESAPATPVGSWLSVFSLPALLLLGLPLIGLFVWGLTLAGSNEGFAQASETVDWWRALANTLVPLWAVWLVQTPAAYLAGLALGFVRPLGRLFSNLAFLGFLLFAAIPVEALSLQWFDAARNLGWVDTAAALLLPWLVSGFSLVIFKLFFDGAHDKYIAARLDGASPADAFLKVVFLPSLPVALVVVAVLSFASLQAFLWPLIVMHSAENFTLPLQMVMLQNQFMTNSAVPVATAVGLMLVGLLIFLPVFALLQVLVLDRLALLAGPSEVETAPVPVADQAVETGGEAQPEAPAAEESPAAWDYPDDEREQI